MNEEIVAGRPRVGGAGGLSRSHPSYEHADEFPEPLVEQMKELGLFGVTIPEEYGGLGLDLTTYALIQVELSRGWMSLSGVLNTHFISAWMIKTFGTDEQRERYLPRMATGEIRSAYSMTEPHAGSDVQSIRTRAVREADEWVITGQKMWATNGLRAGMMTLLAVTDPDAEPRHRGLTAFVLEKEPGAAQQPGLTISAPLKKLGYKGVESVEMSFDGFRAPADAVLGGEAGIGQGFKYFMGGIELGRCNIAARAVGIAMRAFEESIRYAQEREAFGKPIAQHQAIQLKLAQMATKIEASRLLLLQAVEQKDARRARRPRSRDGEVVRDRDRGGGRARGDAHPRGRGLLAGARRRADLPRRAGADPRRGVERDPAAGDRATAARAARDLRWTSRSPTS